MDELVFLSLPHNKKEAFDRIINQGSDSSKPPTDQAGGPITGLLPYC